MKEKDKDEENEEDEDEDEGNDEEKRRIQLTLVKKEWLTKVEVQNIILSFISNFLYHLIAIVIHAFIWRRISISL